MWPFKSPSTQPEPSADVLERLESMERGFRELRVDWDRMFEKFASLSARLAKRAKAQEARDSETPEENGAKPEAVRRNPLAERLLAGKER